MGLDLCSAQISRSPSESNLDKSPFLPRLRRGCYTATVWQPECDIKWDEEVGGVGVCWCGQMTGLVTVVSPDTWYDHIDHDDTILRVAGVGWDKGSVPQGLLAGAGGKQPELRWEQSTRRSGEGPSKDLLRDCEIVADVSIAALVVTHAARAAAGASCG